MFSEAVSSFLTFDDPVVLAAVKHDAASFLMIAATPMWLAEAYLYGQLPKEPHPLQQPIVNP